MKISQTFCSPQNDVIPYTPAKQLSICIIYKKKLKLQKEQRGKGIENFTQDIDYDQKGNAANYCWAHIHTLEGFQDQ